MWEDNEQIMRYGMPELSESWPGRHTLSQYCSTCQFEDKIGDMIYCCKCGDGPQVVSVSPSCYECGHHFLCDGPILSDDCKPKATLNSRHQESLESTFNQLLFQRAAGPAQQWLKQRHADRNPTSCRSPPSNTPLAKQVAGHPALPESELPYDTLELALRPSPSSPGPPARVHAVAQENFQECSHQGGLVFDDRVLRSLDEKDWPNHPPVHIYDLSSMDSRSQMSRSKPQTPRKPTLHKNSLESQQIPEAMPAILAKPNWNDDLLLDTTSPSRSVEMYNGSDTSPSAYSNQTSVGSSDMEDDYSSDASTVESMSFSPSTVPSAISYLARNVVDRVMSGIHFFFDVKSGVIQCTNGSKDASPKENHQNASNRSTSKPVQAKGGSKRRPNQGSGRNPPHGDDDENDDDAGDDEGNKRRKLSDGKQKQPPERRFACCFFKRNPEKYKSRRSCKGPGFSSIHYLKEHLYLYHQIRPCPRCKLDMKTDKALDAHLQESQICEIQASGLCEGIDRDQRSKLKSRMSGKPPTEKWKAIYRILFPKDLDMPSPFYNHDDNALGALDPGSRFHRYCEDELPPRVRARLEKDINQRYRQIYAEIGSQLEDTIRECYSDVVSTFRLSPRAGSALNALMHTEENVPSHHDDSYAMTMAEDCFDQISFIAPDLSFEDFDPTSLDLQTPAMNLNDQTNQDTFNCFTEMGLSTDPFLGELSFPSSSPDEFLSSFQSPRADGFMNSTTSSSTPLLIEHNVEHLDEPLGTAAVKVIPEVRLPNPSQAHGMYSDLTDLLRHDPHM